MPSSILLLLAGLTALAHAQQPGPGDAPLIPGAEHWLNVIYHRGDYATIPGPNGQGSEFGHVGGFTITTPTGEGRYSDNAPGGATYCANSNMKLTVTSDCWDGEYEFNCGTDVYGEIQGCSAVWGLNTENGQYYGEWAGEVNSGINFIGIAISVEGYCGTAFPVARECPPDAKFEVVAHDP